jgi:site-specific recombinase XerD
MFNSLFRCPATLKRHQEGPLATERAAYLEVLAERGVARATLLRRAVFSLCVARALDQVSQESDTEIFSATEVDALASAWAAQRVTAGRAAAPQWPRLQFRAVAVEFIATMGRLRPPLPAPDPHHVRVEDFLAAQAERWPSAATCSNARWHVYRFLAYLDRESLVMESVRPEDVDAYFEHVSSGWCRVSIRTSGKVLKAWFRHAERRGWARSGVAATILLPRLYRHEGLPPGPTWEQVGSMIDRIEGDDPAALRDRALLMLMSTYGLRSGEVRRLQLDDLDWIAERLQVNRSKSLRQETLPMEPGVGGAIARYLRSGRPKTMLRTLFLTLHPPHRPLSSSGLYGVVQRHLAQTAPVARGRGPHGLRHACARHLIESGRSFKEVGDHLGHRSPHATGIYAKVDLVSLRRVALQDLGALT